MQGPCPACEKLGGNAARLRQGNTLANGLAYAACGVPPAAGAVCPPPPNVPARGACGGGGPLPIAIPPPPGAVSDTHPPQRTNTRRQTTHDRGVGCASERQGRCAAPGCRAKTSGRARDRPSLRSGLTDRPSASKPIVRRPGWRQGQRISNSGHTTVRNSRP